MSPFADGTELLARLLSMEVPPSAAGELHAALLAAAKRPEDAGLRRRIEDLGARMPPRLAVQRPGDDPRPGALGELAKRFAISKSLAPAKPGDPAAILVFLERAEDDPAMNVIGVSAAHHEARNGIGAALKALAESPGAPAVREALRKAVAHAKTLLVPPYSGVYHGATFLRFAEFVLEDA